MGQGDGPAQELESRRLVALRIAQRARIYTLIFKPGMKIVTTRAEPWVQSP